MIADTTQDSASQVGNAEERVSALDRIDRFEREANEAFDAPCAFTTRPKISLTR